MGARVIFAIVVAIVAYTVMLLFIGALLFYRSLEYPDCFWSKIILSLLGKFDETEEGDE
jgi:hypothetical protein